MYMYIYIYILYKIKKPSDNSILIPAGYMCNVCANACTHRMIGLFYERQGERGKGRRRKEGKKRRRDRRETRERRATRL